MQNGLAAADSSMCKDTGWSPAEMVVDACFWVDVLLTFRTGYVDGRQMIHMQPTDAAVHYLKTWFLVDLTSSFPFEAVVYGACAPIV
jgi:hypothetical protein